MVTLLQGYRTYVVAALIALFGALEMADWNLLFTDPYAGAVAIFSAAVMAVLRTITTTPPGVSSKDVDKE